MAYNEKPRNSSTLKSLKRGLNVLEEIVNFGQPLKLHELGDRLNIDKSSLHRILATLVQFGVVEKNLRTKEYSIGQKLLNWTGHSSKNQDLIKIAKPFLSKLAFETEQEAHLSVLIDGSAVLIDKAAPETPLSLRTMVGIEAPLHCTALGKAILAFLPEPEREKLIESIELYSFTSKTITDRDELRKHLNNVRLEGVAVDEAEHVGVLNCFASPVFNSDRELIASIGISLIRMSPGDSVLRQNLKSKVVNVASALSKALNDFGF
jgi:DNA-binding IclR family transcriptional regulator